MRFFTFAAVFLGSSNVLAAPANEKRDACCCCDISESTVVCQEKSNCICAAVVCPKEAPTVWVNTVEPPKATEGPVKRRDDGEQDGEQSEDFECCCCDISIPATVCDSRAGPEDCVCLAVVCPEDAPTIRSGDPLPTPTPTPTPEPTPTAPEPCCCCNIGLGSIVCELRTIIDEGCFCPMVMCPEGAPTITIEASQSEETG
ncbi:hypothetical protein G7Z17_g11007 [Cylindrodendrum hubeiense]|uniref:Uncharacterized protein n=1 Tax=Cylindrodendrum hubeiense TaxID=595255 RepID=A0A9P5L6S4_9HYPO|nr:hypothetical protein G7Z17_g11007 [Cylindrodendrum hubeiense]